MIDKIDYLHSLDSLKLASIIDKERTTQLNTFIEVSIKQQNESIGYINHEYKPRVADNLTQVEYYSPKHIYYNLGY